MDTVFHASRATRHNSTKQHYFPTTWKKSPKSLSTSTAQLSNGFWGMLVGLLKASLSGGAAGLTWAVSLIYPSCTVARGVLAWNGKAWQL